MDTENKLVVARGAGWGYGSVKGIKRYIFQL